MNYKKAQLLQHGQIVYADFPFEETSSNSKIRPVYIISHVEKNKVLAIKITTHDERSIFDYKIRNWHKVGLKQSCVARCNKFANIEYNKLGRAKGVLPADEIRAIDTLYQRYCQEKEIKIDDDYDL